MTQLVKTHNSDSNFANFGANATQSIANGAIFVERLSRDKVGTDGRHIDISLAIDIIATSLKAIVSGVLALDDVVGDVTQGIAKKVPKPWIAIARMAEGIPDVLGLVANNLVDLEGNSKVVYYLGLEEDNPEHQKLITQNNTAFTTLKQEFHRIDFLEAVIGQLEINTKEFIKEFVDEWKEALTGTNNDKGMIYYGDNTANAVFGTDEVDYINTKDGNDMLAGLLGNDYLAGGTGYDTYHIFDHDIIYDTDGKGMIIIDNAGAVPDNFVKHTSNLWIAKQNDIITHTAQRQNDDLVIKVVIGNSTNHKATIKDFFKLATYSDTSISALPLSLENKDAEKDKDVIYNTITANPYDLTANVYVTGTKPIHITGSTRDDNIFGATFAHSLIITAGSGHDSIFGGNASDHITGGNGNDIINGSAPYWDFRETDAPKDDNDTIFGNAGNDLINGSVGDDTIYVDEEHSHLIKQSTDNVELIKGDWALGGNGNDKIYGGIGADFL